MHIPAENNMVSIINKLMKSIYWKKPTLVFIPGWILPLRIIGLYMATVQTIRYRLIRCQLDSTPIDISHLCLLQSCGRVWEKKGPKKEIWQRRSVMSWWKGMKDGHNRIPVYLREYLGVFRQLASLVPSVYQLLLILEDSMPSNLG